MKLILTLATTFFFVQATRQITPEGNVAVRLTQERPSRSEMNPGPPGTWNNQNGKWVRPHNPVGRHLESSNETVLTDSTTIEGESADDSESEVSVKENEEEEAFHAFEEAVKEVRMLFEEMYLRAAEDAKARRAVAKENEAKFLHTTVRARAHRALEAAKTRRAPEADAEKAKKESPTVVKAEANAYRDRTAEEAAMKDNFLYDLFNEQAYRHEAEEDEAELLRRAEEAKVEAVQAAMEDLLRWW